MNTNNKEIIEKLNVDADRLAKDLKYYKHLLLVGEDDRMTDERFLDLCNAVCVCAERLYQTKLTCRRIINATVRDDNDNA